MKHPEWFAFTDTEDIVPLGEHETICDADGSAPINTIWLFRDEGLRSLQLRIEQVLDVPEDKA